ncbi:hypothetical protein [Indiicoccus explosivorum]|uniref:hypothetical protein n=1 Tax=Indiicoccus explosivorum TaxID=1917864 RepID=UPI000B44F9FF|nr:hypothetical protein [Indiicoccus explosivorum]
MEFLFGVVVWAVFIFGIGAIVVGSFGKKRPRPVKLSSNTEAAQGFAWVKDELNEISRLYRHGEIEEDEYIDRMTSALVYRSRIQAIHGVTEAQCQHFIDMYRTTIDEETEPQLKKPRD